MSAVECPECRGPKQPTHRLCPTCWQSKGGAGWGDPNRRHLFLDGPPKRGIGDLTALALVALDLSVVRRATIRTLLPRQPLTDPETGLRAKSPVSGQVNRAYRRFEVNGWACRDGDFIRVLDRDGLRSWIEQGVDVTDERAAAMLSVEEAARQVNADLASGAVVSGWSAETARRHTEVRRQELIALERLMQAAPTRNPGVRITPRGRTL